MTDYVFELFIAGNDLLGKRAIKNIKLFCENTFQDNYTLDIIDIEIKQELAGKYRISAIPTLIKKKPLPEMRILGDLTETDQLTMELNLDLD